MSSIGIDGVLVRQEITRPLRPPLIKKGLIGCGIEVEDKKEFEKAYSKAINQLLKKYELEPMKKIYRSKDFSNIFEYSDFESEYKILSEFRDLIIPSVKRVYFFMTYIFGLKGEVSIFGESPQAKRIPLVSNGGSEQDFYDLIANSYPLICAWELKDIENVTFEIDGVQGRIGPFWNELIGAAKIKIFFKGDQCNSIIATADLFTRLMKSKMVPNHKCYLRQEIETILKQAFPKNKIDYRYLGKACLSKMVPHRTKQIKYPELIAHPLYLIIKEDPNDEGEVERIENSPLFSSVVRDAVKNSGAIKYYHPSDTRLIKENDKIVIFGKKGESELKKLLRLQYLITQFK